jgi:hypothetical protein
MKTIKTTLEKEYILIEFIADLTQGTLDAFKVELADAKLLIQKKYEQDHEPVKILLDVSHFTGEYASEALDMLALFAKENALYVKKTASFGGSDKIKMAGGATIALSGRDNICMFDSKIDAVLWLVE